MGKLISFEKARGSGNFELAGDLTAQLKSIISSCKATDEEESNFISLCHDPKTWFEKKIGKELLKRKLIASDMFLCGMYISKLLGEIAEGMPSREYAVDFFKSWEESKDPKCLQEGGDFCFALCGIFPQRCSRRLMKIDYYRKMGAGFYFHYYGVTGKDIGYHMSCNFNVMEGVVKGAIGDQG